MEGRFLWKPAFFVSLHPVSYESLLMNSKHIVVTGSTRGLGLGLARAFLSMGHFVSVSGRDRESVNAVVRELQQEFGPQNAAGFVVDVTVPRSLDQLWLKASLWKPVDIWINNAGVGQSDELFYHIPPEAIEGVIQTNLMGVMNGTRVAYLHMKQQGYGAIYNMEGFGSDGRMMPGMTLYGTSKHAVRYFTRSFARELAESRVLVGTLSPGMVVTGLLLEPVKENPEARRRSIRIFNILADRVETVAPFLARKILRNRKNDVRIAWLTKWKILLRFLQSFFRKREVVFNSDFNQ
jgi:NAD(P)-dependent dehydrogenase (short-subunit alcohol dehydrogenase family)